MPSEIFDIYFCGFSLALTSTGQGGSMFFVFFYVREHPKAQSAAVLVLKRDEDGTTA